MSKKDKKKDKNTRPRIGLWKCIKKVVPFHIKIDPWMHLVSSMIIIIQTVCSSLQLYALEDMTNNVALLARGEVIKKALVISIIIWSVLNIIPVLLSQLANIIDTRLNQRATNAYAMNMYRKMSRLEPISFENTDNLDDINKAENGMGAARELVSLLRNLLLNILPYLAVVSVYLIKREPLLVFAMLVMFLPTLYQQFMEKKIWGDQEDKQAPLRRKRGHYGECITNQKYYKETRLLGGYRYFIRHFSKLFKKEVDNDFKEGLKSEALFFTSILLSTAGRLFVYYLLFRFLINGRISVGEYAAVFLSLGRIYDTMYNLFYNVFRNLSRQLPYIENYVRFINFDEARSEYVELPESFPISLTNVKFKYPNQESYALDGVTFSVKPKETIAIVGENGSGKSTLIKLITGYYVPESGEVRINGNNTAKMSYKSVARRIAAVFQRFPHYALTLKENLVLGQSDAEPNEARMRLACEMSGFAPEDDWLPNGFDTVLSREFDDGIGISGGQAQRIAIARAFYRNSSLIVLDEPTAAIDPIEEAKIYKRFAELSKDKTAFIVTHRLASVKIADRIIMMKNGKAVEIGTHDELMTLNGEYKRMYDSQKQWYDQE